MVAGEDFRGCLMVPLNPAAMRDVLASGLDYVKIEEHYDFDFFREQKEEIARAFDLLFGAADGAVAAFSGREELAQLGPFAVYYMYLRLNIETEAVYYRIFESIVRSYRPSEILLCSRVAEPDAASVVSARFAGNYHLVLLQELAAREGVPFACSLVASQPGTGSRDLRARLVGALRRKVYNCVKRSRTFHDSRLFTKERVAGKLKKKALFLQSGWGVFYYSQYFSKVLFDTTPIEKITSSRPDCRQLDALLDRDAFQACIDPAVGLLNRVLGVEVSFITGRELTAFLDRVPLILSHADALSEYLLRTKPDLVFYTNLDEAMLPIQLALDWSKDIAKVIKCHGDSIFDFTVWRRNELAPADLYLTEFPELAQYFQTAADLARLGTSCECDGVKLNAGKRVSKPKKKLLYVPWLFLPGLGCEVVSFPSPLLYRIQIAILEELNKLEQYSVVYKALRTGFMDYHFPVPAYIDKHFPNVQVSYRPLHAELQSAQCCLLDAPSSSMWEAMEMRVPCHSLVWSKFHLRDTGVGFYREFLTFFDSELDVGAQVRSIVEDGRFCTITDQQARSVKKSPAELLRIFRKITGGG